MVKWTKIGEDPKTGKKFYVSDAPTYIRHIKRTEAGSIRWSLDLSNPPRRVADGIASSLAEAKVAIDEAIRHDKQRRSDG